MRRLAALLAVPLVVGPLVLAGCDRRHTQVTDSTVTIDGVTTKTHTVSTGVTGPTKAEAHADAQTGTASVSGLDIDTDKFKANLQIPGLNFGGDDMDLDGMKLYPGSTVKGMRVKASDRNGDKRGTVTMDFASPAAPATVAAHMVAQAKQAGFAVASSSAAGLTATKADGDGDNRFVVTLNPNGDATLGQMTMTGTREN